MVFGYLSCQIIAAQHRGTLDFRGLCRSDMITIKKKIFSQPLFFNCMHTIYLHTKGR